jgi:dihydroorotate dehydrogenase (NAD+) catalytic subunit
MIRITRTGKHSLVIQNPVMPAAGIMGFANAYYSLINSEKLGAYVTNPITYEAWSPASGTRVVPLDAGILVHTGLPNPGLKGAIKEYSPVWHNMPVPVILHLVATTPDLIRRAVEMIDREDGIAAIELGLDDDIDAHEASSLVKAATSHAEKPVLVRLPVYDAYELAPAAVDAGADALVIASPPRGTARDPRSGRLVSGRVYGPLIKPMVLRLVGVLARRIQDVPIIGAGGIHTLQDARDYLEAGAVAVQIDSVAWIQPNLVERIARDLGGSLVTRATDAFPDEWHPDMGDTEFRRLFGDDQDDSASRRG